MAEVERFDKAYGITLLLLFALIPIAFIPILGPILYTILVPFYAGKKGGHYLCKRHAMISGLMASITAVIVFFWVVIAILEFAVRSIPGQINYSDPVGLLIMASFFTGLIVFTLIGSYIGGRARTMFED